MLLVPREFGKTTLISRAGQLWLHVQNPDLATYLGSESQKRSEEFLSPIPKIISGADPSAKFPWLYGNWYDASREWRNASLVHGARKGVSRPDYSFGTWSVERGITGHHPDAGFFDDPISYETLGMHSDWFRVVNDHVASLLPVFGDKCLMVFVGTRYGDGDHLGTQLRKHGACTWEGMPKPDDYTTGTAMPMIRPEGKWHVYFLDARDANEEPIFPERCGESFLREQQLENDLKYWAQMRNNPSKSVYTPLGREHITPLWIEPHEAKGFKRIIINLDTAFKSQTRQAAGDESVMVVWGSQMDGTGYVTYLEGYGSNIWKMEDFLDRLVLLVQKWRKRRHIIITDEPEPGGKSGTWEYAIRTACHSKGIPAPPLVTLSRASKKKIDRIVQAADYWAQGYVKLVRDAPGVEQLINQMVRIGNSAHDDWSDAAADIFHPTVYSPLKMLGTIPEVQAPIIYPGDEILKSGRMTDQEATKHYDEHWTSKPDRIYDPV